MATVKIELDTDGETAKRAKPGSALSERSLQVVSTIKLADDLRDAFQEGAGQDARYFQDKDYDDIKDYMSNNLNDPTFLVVTAGGSIAFLAAKAALTNARFVSMVGTEPANSDVGGCFGGVTFDSVNMNSDRVDYLESKGRTRAGIGLFCNKKSAMNPDEVANWANIPGVNTKIAYGGNKAGKNDPNSYPNDFAGIDPSVTTLIISADPHFQNTKNKLIKAANDWIDAMPAVRHVCYPLADYANVDGNAQPKPTKGSWYGPSLVKAYKELGKAAAQARTASNPIGFSSIAATKGQF